MLFLSLALSVTLLVLANLLVLRTKYGAIGVLPISLVLVIVPARIMDAMLPALAWQAFGLCVLLVVRIIPRLGRGLYLALSCAVTLMAYLHVHQATVEHHERLAQLRQKYPYETIESRLPVRLSTSNGASVDFRRLEAFEKEMQEEGNDYEAWRWWNAMQSLHEKSVKDFVGEPGFGFGRMNFAESARPSDFERMESFLPRPADVPQPDYLNRFLPPLKGLTRAMPDWDDGLMLTLHNASVIDFANPRGFGYVKDRGHVAGFRSHGMSKAPEAKVRWSVARVELVGLVVHEQPVVYASDQLPRMDGVAKMTTRPLDSFELQGLESLRRGEDLYYGGANTLGRMIGSIRAVTQCLPCHGGNRGDLLGAFSYGLRREPRP